MKNWRTSLASIVTALGLVPGAIEYLNLTEVPEWLKIVGGASSFFAFIGMGLLAKDKVVTGVGPEAETKAEINNRYEHRGISEKDRTEILKQNKLNNE